MIKFTEAAAGVRKGSSHAARGAQLTGRCAAEEQELRHEQTILDGVRVHRGSAKR